MSDANQVRINELARELEVKAKAIIDLLPGFGVTEKKTHSSSIPEDVAEKVKDHLKGVADAETAAEADRSAKEAAAKAALRSRRLQWRLLLLLRLLRHTRRLRRSLRLQRQRQHHLLLDLWLSSPRLQRLRQAQLRPRWLPLRNPLHRHRL